MLRLALLMLCLSACAPVIQKEYVNVELTHEPRPLLPKLTAQELACLDKVTYQKLFDRERLIVGYTKTLEALIESTVKHKE